MSIEYELFSASKLPVSYKAAVMRRVNEIIKLTEQCELHLSLIPHTTDKCVDVTDKHVDDTVEYASHTLASLAENESSFGDASPVDNGAVDVMHYNSCDKDDIALSPSKPSMESCDNYDAVKSDNVHELCSTVQSPSVCETITANKNTDLDDDCWKDEPSHKHRTPPNHVIHSQAPVKSEFMLVADTMANRTSAAVKKNKTVRISDSPPTVSYIDWQHEEVCNGASKSILKVSELLYCMCLHSICLD